MAAGISRLGRSSAFITVTGEDKISEFVRGIIEGRRRLVVCAKLCR